MTRSLVIDPFATHTTPAGFSYPAKYGVGECAAWDATMQPDCADAAGAPKENAPEWCADSWCWVDQTNCKLADTDVTKSAYFPGSSLVFSYNTCGKKSTFDTWIGTPQRHLACT